jgi:hypothetical protein
MSRRGLLRGVAAIVGLAGAGSVAGCDLFGDASDADPLELTPALADLLTHTVALRDAYEAAIARAPSLTNLLSGPRDTHHIHAEALAQVLSQPTPQPAPTSGGTADPSTVLSDLVSREREALSEAHAACLSAPGRLASLVGSIAAARACHVEVLQ